MKFLLASLLLLSVAIPAAADEAPTAAVAKEQQTLESYAATNKTCREWSDGCAVCARHDNGTFACSLPGIACQPTGLTCRRVAEVPKESGPKESGTKDAGAAATPAK